MESRRWGQGKKSFNIRSHTTYIYVTNKTRNELSAAASHLRRSHNKSKTVKNKSSSSWCVCVSFEERKSERRRMKRGWVGVAQSVDLPPDDGGAGEDQVFGRRLLRDALSGVVCLYNLSGAL
jgi:hypothetical protein